MKKDISEYEDIIDLPHHTSDVHPKMSRHDRAAQFAPFAALSGFEDLSKQTALRHGERVDKDLELLTEICHFSV